MTDWKMDAREFGRFVKKGGWYVAYLAARRVKEGAGNGRPPTNPETLRNPEGFCGIGAFAKEAGLHHETVLAYLKTWDRAADGGIVPPRGTFVGTEHNVPMPDDEVEPWSQWHSATANAGRHIKDPGTRDALIEQANADGVGASKVLDVASNKRAVVAAVKADPSLAAAIAADPGASVAVSRERNRIDDAKGVRDPAELDRERKRKRVENGPTLVEILELSARANEIAALADRFLTPVDGASPYRDTARVQIEAAIARIRASVQHIEDVMNGAVDTRIPDDIGSLVSE